MKTMTAETRIGSQSIGRVTIQTSSATFVESAARQNTHVVAIEHATATMGMKNCSGTNEPVRSRNDANANGIAPMTSAITIAAVNDGTRLPARTYAYTAAPTTIA